MQVKCESAQRELSARLDGAPDPRLDLELARHLESCARCRAFAAGAERLREVVRLEPAAPVPDLVPAIMAQLRDRGDVVPLRRRRAPVWAAAAAAFVAGAVVAALVAGGLPGLRPGPSPALAAEIPERIAAASKDVLAYRAEFHLVEHGFHPRVPERRFAAEVSFRAPEAFRVRMTDLTSYPGGPWPRNDFILAVDGERWMLDTPRTCPSQALPSCAPEGRDVRTVVGRPPFDGEAALPTDIVLPVRTLAGSDRVGVVRETSVAGRDAVVVQLAFRDAVPLFDSLQAGGIWRPFFPHDRVLVSLDAESWFPLAFEVRAGDSPERGLWAERNGLPREHPGQVLLRGTAGAFETESITLPSVPMEGPARDLGFRETPPDDLPAVAGYDPVEPRTLEGLSPYRAGVFRGGGRPPDEVLLSYARGLSWLVIRQTGSWDGPGLFGDVGPLAERVELPGAGVAYYEPATASLGRRVAVHADGRDIALESNLSREALLRIAGSLPMRGVEAPRGWVEQDTLAEARHAAPFLLMPSRLPAEYRIASVQVDGSAVTVHFRRPGAELDGGGIRLHQAEGIGLPPPLELEVLAVQVRGVTGRYSPIRGELEWVEDGVYRSLGGSSLAGSPLDLQGLLEVARSLEPAS
jgi:hypothetical protein